MARVATPSQQICRLCGERTLDGRTCAPCREVRQRISEVLDNHRDESTLPPPWLNDRIELYAVRARAREPLFQGEA